MRKAILAIPVLLLAGPARADYTVTDLGTVTSYSTNITSNGSVVVNGVSGTFIYTNGAVTNLQGFNGYHYAVGVNNSGQVLGEDTGGSTARGFVYSQGNTTYIPQLPSGLGTSVYAINNSGEVTGESYPGDTHAIIYFNGQTTDLYPNGDSGGTAINNLGQVAGGAVFGGQTHAAYFSGGSVTDLGTLGGQSSVANGINDNGEIVGRSLTASSATHGFAYVNGVMTDLGALAQGTYSSALSVNSSGVIVGFSSTYLQNGPTEATIYEDGQLINLNTLLDLPGINLEEAVSINDLGQILVYGGTASDPNHEYILTPVAPSPPGLVMFGAGLAGAAVLRPGRRAVAICNRLLSYTPLRQ